MAKNFVNRPNSPDMHVLSETCFVPCKGLRAFDIPPGMASGSFPPQAIRILDQGAKNCTRKADIILMHAKGGARWIFVGEHPSPLAIRIRCLPK